MQTIVPSVEEIMALETTLTGVESRPDFVLHLSYSDGESYELDFKPLIAKGGVMSRIADAAVFSQARPVQQGWAVEFPGDVDFDADTLRWYGELARRGLNYADQPVH
jgi:hypothetical protein